MADLLRSGRWQTDGKFFRAGDTRVWLRAVTYGPFPAGDPVSVELDFRHIAAAGFNAIRLFEMPDRRLLDAALAEGLQVFAGLEWGYSVDFFRRPGLFSAARAKLVEALRKTATHPALAGVYVGNEIRPDLVRWVGPLRVRHAIEDLIALGREAAPHMLFAYANFPSTEYLEPENADFSAFNVYLEDPATFRNYLKRLHHIAGDRPLVISEFGVDSQRNGVARQAESLAWAITLAHEEETAGLTIFGWSDRWQNGGATVFDWDFGLIDRAGNDKPALDALSAVRFSPVAHCPDFSVIVCTRNGRDRIGHCLEAVRNLAAAGGFETIVVDNGSVDGTADFVREYFSWVKLLELDSCGLSAARNAGAEVAIGEIMAFTDDDCAPDHEWLVRLARVFADPRFAAVGGPNLPPKPRNWHEAVVAAAPGAPSHVMLDDEEAEHLPGCNLAVTKAAFNVIGGFDPIFRTAGDDVDFCWRLRAAGFRLGFAPGAFVWHWRRSAIRGFLKQQIGYGQAERLLIAKHPAHFTRQGLAKWQGFVYGGGPVRVMADSIIYHGPMGSAGYQSVQNRMLPLRGLDGRFDRWRVQLALRLAEFLTLQLRSWARSRRIILTIWKRRTNHDPPHESHELEFHGVFRDDLLQQLLADGWQPGGATDAWDAEKQDTRILLATEYGDHGNRQTLVRIWGDVSLLQLKQFAAQ